MVTEPFTDGKAFGVRVRLREGETNRQVAKSAKDDCS
jgi:hypothetical protein